MFNIVFPDANQHVWNCNGNEPKTTCSRPKSWYNWRQSKKPSGKSAVNIKLIMLRLFMCLCLCFLYFVISKLMIFVLAKGFWIRKINLIAYENVHTKSKRRKIWRCPITLRCDVISGRDSESYHHLGIQLNVYMIHNI